jgi:hypothetical protein
MSKDVFYLCVFVTVLPFVVVAIGAVWLIVDLLGWWTAPVAVWLTCACVVVAPSKGSRMGPPA